MGTQGRKTSEGKVAGILRKWVGQGRPISVDELAWDAQLSDDTITNYAKDHTRPDVNFLQRIAHAYAGHQPRFVLELFNEGILDGSDFRLIDVRQFDADEADVNRNGRVDAHDSAQIGVQAVGDVQRFLGSVMKSLEDGRICDAERAVHLGQVETIEQTIRLLKTSLVEQGKGTG